MKKLRLVITIIALTGALFIQSIRISYAQADDTTPSLVISQLKVTSGNGQFITLYNATDTILDLTKYQIEYFNHYDLRKATTSRMITLSGTIPPHGYFMVNDSALVLCYQLLVDSQSLGLSSTAGMIEVVARNQLSAGGSVTSIVQDYVTWSKTPANGAQTLPTNTAAFLQRFPPDSQNNPAIDAPGAGSWLSVQPDDTNACNLIATGSSGMVIATGLNQLLPSTEPPVTLLESTAVAGTSAAAMSANNIGLMAPTITEILPNPAGSGNDSTEEFIELYNANTKSFDLSGFSLQANSSRTFTFPNGTILAPQSFTAFYTKMTGLSLSNSSGLAKLLSPLTSSISATGMYTTAKDGQAWALAKGKWYWTTTPTPGKANAIREPATAKKTATGKSKSPSKTKAAKTPKKKLKNTKKVSSAFASDEPSTTPIHTRALALVAGLALLYGAYEYRTDMANRFHQFKRNLKHRYENRSQIAWRRSHRTRG